MSWPGNRLSWPQTSTVSLPQSGPEELPEWQDSGKGPWTCLRCQTFNPEEVTKCNYCQYVRLAAMPDPVVQRASLPVQIPQAQPTSGTSSQVWVCGCGYEYNLQPTCLKCKQPDPRQKQSPQPVLQTLHPMLWICPKPGCGYEYNTKDKSECGKCQTRNPALQPVSVSLPNRSYSAELPTQTCWTCSGCGTQNNQSRTDCYYCNQQQASSPVSAPLQPWMVTQPVVSHSQVQAQRPGSTSISLNVTMTIQGDSWICEHCNCFTKWNALICYNCEKPSPLADQFRHYFSIS